jgi:predicted NACHT family NTPase
VALILVIFSESCPKEHFFSWVIVTMETRAYNWKRFWCPRTGRIDLSDGGYMVDPDSEWGRIYNPDVVPFESIAGVPCLVLLGEPGIGKTVAMRGEYEAIKVKAQDQGDDTSWLDLRSFGSEDRLVRNLFESTTFIRWIEGEHRLHLFLDSLDECLLRIDTVATLLADELKKYPVERLCLRIACRTADWPNVLERALRELWGEEAVQVFELAPLRRVDVREAAKANGLDPDAFRNEVERKEVVPLAIKPVTLRFLLNLYQKHGSFPHTQAELYFHGCRLLCEEISESRIAAGLRGELTAEQRMAVAARVAAITMFANRDAIWTGPDFGDIPEEDVTIQELCGDKESVDGNEFKVTRSAVEETLATGLFSSRGPNRLGWAHKTYAEFLAARYLLENKMAVKQMMSLVVHPGDPEGKLVPQLHETVAWLAGMNSEIFRQVMSKNPEVLLRSDVATTDTADRAALVESLLKLFEEEKLIDRDIGLYQRYRKLNHPALAGQLRPYICDGSKSIIVRRVAIDIAEACELQALQDELVNIALDPSETLPVRVQAACAVYRIGDTDAKAKLKPLATGKVNEDPDDELKGYGLQAVWPTSLTAEELFSVLTPPKRRNLIGAYRVFIEREVAPRLKPSDLPVALKWVKEQQRRHHLPYSLERLTDAIMLRAWENLEVPGVAEAFAEAALSRLKQHDAIIEGKLDPPFRDLLAIEDDKRRRVLKTMVPLLGDPQKDSVILACGQTPLLLSKDVPWMVEQLLSSVSEEAQRVWAALMWTAFDPREPSQLDAVFMASKKNRVLAETFEGLFEPVELGSPQAEKMKAEYQERQKWEKRERERPVLKPPPAERIAILLDKFESGDLAAWWRLNLEMTLEPDSTHYGNELESDLTVLPGWTAGDDRTKARIIEAAKKYVLDQDPETHKWLGTNTLYRPAFAGYRALRLLSQKDPGFLSALSSDIWRKWAPMILAYPVSSGIGGEGPHYELVKMAYHHAPEEIINILLILIDKENEEGNHIFIIRKVEHCWDDRLAAVLLNKVKDRKLKAECMGSLLCELLDHGIKEARAFAESLVNSFSSLGDEDERSRAVVAASMLMLHTEDAGWSVVWPAIQKNPEFAHEVLLLVADRFDDRAASIGSRLTEDQLADLYIWLVRRYPYSEDPEYDDVHCVRPRESIAKFRNSLLQHLKRRGTYQACEAIRRVIYELPQVTWLKWSLLEAQSLARYHSWVPLLPRDILKMTKSRDIRLVQNGDQLLDVIIESLNRFEAKLHGETSLAFILWNEIKKGLYRPKQESEISDVLKSHLDEDLKQRGIIVNREVEIRRGYGSSRGEKTDIHVDAVMPSSHREAFDSVSAIIEVKGCWNKGLNDAMKTQLVDRYLKDNRCQHGLYVVGWFNCGQWDEDDYRKREAPVLNLTEAQKIFEAQAAELSKQGERVRALVINMALR